MTEAPSSSTALRKPVTKKQPKATAKTADVDKNATAPIALTRAELGKGILVNFEWPSVTGVPEKLSGVVDHHGPYDVGKGSESGVRCTVWVEERKEYLTVPYADLQLAGPTSVQPIQEPRVPILPVVPLTPGTLGLHEVPLSQTIRSSCNVRSHYDPAAIEELAASLAAQGQQQNASGRWNAEGQIEIVAGESRRRAQLLRLERGEITDGFPFLVRLSEMTDGEALAISATENMRRRSMTALEECEAMQRLQDAGRTVEDLTALFGYKSLQPVADRILVARNLLTGAREALDDGRVSLAQAFVIARAPGQNLQKELIGEARYRSAADLAKTLTQGQFLVKNACFNVEKSGLKVVRDLFDAFDAYFESKPRALEAQIAHANALAEKRRVKGDRAFVAVETGEQSSLPTYSHKLYEYSGETAADAGTVIYVCTASGVIAEEKRLRLKKAARATVQADGSVSTEKIERKMPESAHLEAHRHRAAAAREAVLGNTHLTLALTVWGLILGSNTDIARIKVDPCSQSLDIPELEMRATALAELLREKTKPGAVRLAALGGAGVEPNSRRLLETLVAMTDDELLGHLNTLACRTAYDWSTYSNDRPPLPEYTYLATLTGAADLLARDFTLTDEWLKRYPRHELVALAEEAGLGRALVEDCKTLKEMRGRILEHANRLHAEGFVPKLVQFGAVKA